MSDYLLHNYGPRDLTIVRGQGSWVWDAQGNRYLDCVTGVAVNAFGHQHAPIVAAVKAQLECYLHASNLYLMEPQVRLAEALCRAMGMDKAFFGNSGTEANEGAIKFARRHWLEKGKPSKIEILTFTSSFHGRTYASMAATGQEKIRAGFGPLPEGFRVLPVNDASALRAAVGPDTAAILFEPILAEGGIITLSQEVIDALKEAQAKGALLIADEIQTGLGRTGEILASRAMGLDPDIITLAKPLGGGLPLGAILLREAVAASIHVGDHGSTFGGNPVACAAGLAVVGELLRPGFLADVRERAAALRTGLESLIQRKSAQGIDCGPVVGKGFLTGFRFGGDLGAFQKACRANGLLVHRAGQDVIRLLPPLNIMNEEIAALIDRLDRSMVL
ncbi:MAG: acetylornithine and succinylornithine aminotransferase [Fibrobacteres bacterium]|nr:acetylornithine and succinylornithine aminotransferase [Fibrobacterota bacterium]